MTIGEIIRQGLHYARTCRSLWLFGFFVGMANGGSSGGGGGNGRGSSVGLFGLRIGTGDFFGEISGTTIALIVAVIVLAVVVAFVMHFVSEGALIEGIVRAREGGTMTTREGFRAGWRHWGVLLRIALVYFAVFFGSLALLVIPCLIVLRAIGWIGAVAFGVPALFIAVPWFITLHLVQAFAARIAVLENRHTFDAISKSRLFLHGRLRHALRLVVASFAGTIGIVVLGLVAIVPVAVALIASIPALGFPLVLVLVCVVLLPAICVWIAFAGTFRSSIWTIGYVTQVES
jgi:hypothetical protein